MGVLNIRLIPNPENSSGFSQKKLNCEGNLGRSVGNHTGYMAMWMNVLSQ